MCKWRMAKGLAGWTVPFVSLFAALIVGCAGDPVSQRAPDVDSYGRPSLYDRPYQRRQYGPWDMPGAGMQPGPPTWYGCPQQAANCY